MPDDPVFGDEHGLLSKLMEDASKSVNRLAVEMGSYRQRVWRDRQALERDGVVWGYAAVVDETRLGWQSYLVLYKTKPLSRDLANRILAKLRQFADRPNVFLRDFGALWGGDYDWMVSLSTKTPMDLDHAVRELEEMFGPDLEGRPWTINVALRMASQGKLNPYMVRIAEMAMTDPAPRAEPADAESPAPRGPAGARA